MLLDISSDFYCISRASRHSNADNYGVRRSQGGVALFWMKTLSGVSPISELTHDRICGLRIQTKRNRVINIFSVYMPSQGSSDDFETTFDECAELINSRENEAFNIVCGDFNGDVGHLGGPKSSRKPTKQGLIVNKFFNEFSLFPANLSKDAVGPINTFRGGMGSSTIDYVAIPEGLRDSLITCEVLKDNVLNTSDHYAIRVELNLECLPSMVTCPRLDGRVRWNKPNVINKYHDLVDRKTYDLSTVFRSSPKNPKNIDECISQMVHTLTSASAELPHTKFKKNVRPYWDPTLTELKRVKVRCHRIWRDAQRPRGEDQLYLNHKQARKNFMNELRQVQKDYERREIDEIIYAAHSNKNKFWKKVRKSRQSSQNDVYAIRQPSGKVVYDNESVVNVWRDHFEQISLPRESPNFDPVHYENVTQQVKVWSEDNSDDDFLTEEFSVKEIRNGLKVLKKRKAAGCDGLTTEHLVHAGDNLVFLLRLLYNSIIETEYVPENFCRGTQIPLYKGKNLCPLDVNNYRGITLLTCMNKLFEVIIWERIKTWWDDEGIISPLQGACRKGSSCIHSAYILQESIATGLDTKSKVFVAYFDGAKAFDSVWTDGLFYQLHNAGLVGKTWRILYKSYEDFRCQVRLSGIYSKWYIKGGFLSLLKYAPFIDPLLREIET